MMTKEELGIVIEANRKDGWWLPISADIRIWPYRGKETCDVYLGEPFMVLNGVGLDDIYSIITGRTDLALVRILEPLCGDMLVALRFATP